MNRKGGVGRAYLIRFTDEESKRLVPLLRKRRLTGQAFGHAAIMRALNEALLGKRADSEIERDLDLDHESRRPAPQGLGIRDRLHESRDDEDNRDRQNEARPSTVVTTSTPVLAQSRIIDDEILALARTVVESPLTARKEVLKAACRALTRGRTQEEYLRLADDLDAAIKRIDSVPQTALERVRARMGR